MDVRDCINFLLSASQNKVFKYFSNRLSEYGITPAQYGVLNCLWQYGDLSPSRIREILILEASSISGILDRMQKSDLIERRIDPNNRRAIIVSPTKKAMSLKDDVEVIVDDMNEKFLSPFTTKEQELLKKRYVKLLIWIKLNVIRLRSNQTAFINCHTIKPLESDFFPYSRDFALSNKFPSICICLFYALFQLL